MGKTLFCCSRNGSDDNNHYDSGKNYMVAILSCKWWWKVRADFMYISVLSSDSLLCLQDARFWNTL